MIGVFNTTRFQTTPEGSLPQRFATRQPNFPDMNRVLINAVRHSYIATNERMRQAGKHQVDIDTLDISELLNAYKKIKGVNRVLTVTYNADDALIKSPIAHVFVLGHASEFHENLENDLSGKTILPAPIKVSGRKPITAVRFQMQPQFLAHTRLAHWEIPHTLRLKLVELFNSMNAQAEVLDGNSDYEPSELRKIKRSEIQKWVRDINMCIADILSTPAQSRRAGVLDEARCLLRNAAVPESFFKTIDAAIRDLDKVDLSNVDAVREIRNLFLRNTMVSEYVGHVIESTFGLRKIDPAKFMNDVMKIAQRDLRHIGQASGTSVNDPTGRIYPADRLNQLIAGGETIGPNGEVIDNLEEKTGSLPIVAYMQVGENTFRFLQSRGLILRGYRSFSIDVGYVSLANLRRDFVLGADKNAVPMRIPLRRPKWGNVDEMKGVVGINNAVDTLFFNTGIDKGPERAASLVSIIGTDIENRVIDGPGYDENLDNSTVKTFSGKASPVFYYVHENGAVIVEKETFIGTPSTVGLRRYSDGRGFWMGNTRTEMMRVNVGDFDLDHDALFGWMMSISSKPELAPTETNPDKMFSEMPVVMHTSDISAERHVFGPDEVLRAFLQPMMIDETDMVIAMNRQLFDAGESHVALPTEIRNVLQAPLRNIARKKEMLNVFREKSYSCDNNNDVLVDLLKTEFHPFFEFATTRKVPFQLMKIPAFFAQAEMKTSLLTYYTAVRRKTLADFPPYVVHPSIHLKRGLQMLSVVNNISEIITLKTLIQDATETFNSLKNKDIVWPEVEFSQLKVETEPGTDSGTDTKVLKVDRKSDNYKLTTGLRQIAESLLKMFRAKFPNLANLEDLTALMPTWNEFLTAFVNERRSRELVQVAPGSSSGSGRPSKRYDLSFLIPWELSRTTDEASLGEDKNYVDFVQISSQSKNRENEKILTETLISNIVEFVVLPTIAEGFYFERVGMSAEGANDGTFLLVRTNHDTGSLGELFSAVGIDGVQGSVNLQAVTKMFSRRGGNVTQLVLRKSVTAMPFENVFDKSMMAASMKHMLTFANMLVTEEGSEEPVQNDRMPFYAAMNLVDMVKRKSIDKLQLMGATMMMFCKTNPVALAETVRNRVHPGLSVDFLRKTDVQSEDILVAKPKSMEMILSWNSDEIKLDESGSITGDMSVNIQTATNMMTGTAVLAGTCYPCPAKSSTSTDQVGNPIVMTDSLTLTGNHEMSKNLTNLLEFQEAFREETNRDPYLTSQLTRRDIKLVAETMLKEEEFRKSYNETAAAIENIRVPDAYVPIVTLTGRPDPNAKSILGIPRSYAASFQGTTGYLPFQWFYNSRTKTTNPYFSNLGALYNSLYTKPGTHLVLGENGLAGKNMMLPIHSISTSEFTGAKCHTTRILERYMSFVDDDLSTLNETETNVFNNSFNIAGSGIWRDGLVKLDNIPFNKENDKSGKVMMSFQDVVARFGFSVGFTVFTVTQREFEAYEIKSKPHLRGKFVQGRKMSDMIQISPYTAFGPIRVE